VTVDLASRELGGSGSPALVVLHGLLGSSRNWQSAGAALAARGPRVIALDLRNHGDSPWADDCGFAAWPPTSPPGSSAPALAPSTSSAIPSAARRPCGSPPSAPASSPA